jgi:oligopeptidase B
MSCDLVASTAPLLLASALAWPAEVAEPAAHPAPAEAPPAPIAAVRPQALTAHGQTRVDPYYWLRDDTRSDPAVLDHLRAENAHTAASLAHTLPLQETLYREIVGRIPPNDSTAPVKDGAYWYQTRYAEGREYPLYVRRRHGAGGPSGPEEVLLDVNLLAAEHDYYAVGGREVSPDDSLLAYTEDTVSRRQYAVRIKDLRTGELLADVLRNASPDIAWANDNRTLFWVEKDPTTLLPYRVRRHLLGTDPAADAVVHEELDPAFTTGLYRSASRRYVVIHLSSTRSSEMRLLDADQPAGRFWVFLPREPDHEYEAEDCGERFFVRTNWRAENFRIVEVAAGKHADKDAWRDVLPHRDDAFVHGFECLRGFLAVSERSGGLRQIRVKPLAPAAAAGDPGAAGGRDYLLRFDEPAYVARLGDNREPDSTILRYEYTSLTTPESVWELDLESGERRLLKRETVVGDFDPARYTTEYLRAPARDGASIPVSLVYRRDLRREGGAPLYLMGYGAYGISREPEWNAARLSLLDRGWVVAIAHVRGGQELGRRWYTDGKLLKKKNTFHDFIDATEFLGREKYAARDQVVAVGRSAGGLLVGAVANLRPDLYRAVVAGVPFVDAVTTMLDDSIPLTTGEFDEWGNPAIREHHDYMLSYSPYDQVARQDYPAMLVTAGLWDSQVQYYEPAKWVAKLRALKTDRNPLLLWVNLEAGHSGASGRFRKHRDTAMEFAFLLDLVGPNAAAAEEEAPGNPGTPGTPGD